MSSSPGESDLKAFISRQFVLLDREKNAEIERSSLLISKCSQTVLERRGLALGGLGVASVSIGLGGKSLVELERPSAYHPSPVFPPHSFRPGDVAQIDEHRSAKNSTKVKATGEQPKAVEGVIYKVSDTKIVVAVSTSERSSEDELELPERCALIKLANTVTHDRMRRAIEGLEKFILPSGSTSDNVNSPNLNALHRILLGMSPPSSPSKNTHGLFFDDNLNPSQVKAIKFALNAAEVACIHGPPGTGKTRALVEIIRQLVYDPNKTNFASSDEAVAPKPKRILVCGASNLAVDNLVERLSTPPNPPVSYSSEGVIDVSEQKPDEKHRSKPLSPILLTRLGHPARVLSSLYNRTLDYQVQNSDETALVKDVKAEIEQLLGALSGKGSKKPASTGTSGRNKDILALKKGQRLKGGARREAWKNVTELRKEYRKREGGVVKTILSKAQVVLTTCHGAGSRQLQNMEFDILIIDEATQAMEALCWIPVLKAKKLILAGDPMQLGPTIISEGNRRHQKDKGSKVKATPTASSQDVPTDGSEPPSSTDVDSEDDRVEEEAAIEKVPEKEKKKTTCILRPPRSLNKTLFDRVEDMYGSKVKLMLDVQYRMNTKIASFPSKTLYHSRLKSDGSNSRRVLRDLPEVNQSEEFEDVVGEGTEVVFYDTAGAEFWERSGNDGDEQLVGDDGASLCNENEATVVKNWVDKLISAGVKPSQISIITPYQAQCQLLSRLIVELGLEIGTADGMQGRENEAIILSLVRSNPEGEVGFLKEKRRLNVAMTRAKRHLCVVGDSETISRCGGRYLKRWMKWLEKEAEVRFAGDLVN